MNEILLFAKSRSLWLLLIGPLGHRANRPIRHELKLFARWQQRFPHFAVSTAAVCFITPPSVAEAKYCDDRVCLSVCTYAQWRRNYGDRGLHCNPQVQDLYPLYPPSQRCGLCQNFKQTTLTTRLYKVRTNLYPPLTKTFRRACVREHISGTTQPILTKMCMTYICGSVLLWWRCDSLCTSGLWMTSYLHIMGHMQGCRCNTGTASQSA